MKYKLKHNNGEELGVGHSIKRKHAQVMTQFTGTTVLIVLRLYMNALIS